MEFRSIDGQSYIALTEWEADDYGVKAAVAIRDGDFAGANHEVWFFRDAFVAFVQALRKFSDTHEDEAQLESMSPNEAALSIRHFDLARHVVVEAQLSYGHFIRVRSVDNQVAVIFELDPSRLPDVVHSLEAIISDPEPA